MIKIGIIVRNNKINEELLNILKNVVVIFIPINYKNNINIEFNKLKLLTNDLSGIIFPGGNDINDIDLLFIEYLYKINIPILGICLGMQEMSSVFNGNLTEVSNHNSKNNYVHKIYIKNNSKLYSILKENCIYVNSRHSYSVLNTNLKVCAISDDSVIEAVESIKNNFFIGVQWHPESVNDIYSKRLFNSFLVECDNYDVNKMSKK